MPNWCSTSYVIDGKRKEVQSLFSKMNNLENRRKPLVSNTFGKRWLGCLVTKLGGDWQKVYCRGSWSDLDWNGAILRFNTETAWGPMDEVFRFIKKQYPSLEIYWQAEEDGNGVYCSNDVEGRYFKDRYRIEHDCCYEYFSTLDGLSEYVSGIIGKEVKTMDDINAAIETWNNATDDYDAMIYLNEYTVEADELL